MVLLPVKAAPACRKVGGSGREYIGSKYLLRDIFLNMFCLLRQPGRVAQGARFGKLNRQHSDVETPSVGVLALLDVILDTVPD